MASGKNIPRALYLAVVLLFLLASAATTPFWRSTAEALSIDMSSYRELRVRYGFGGMPLDEIVARLNGILPASQPVALDKTIENDTFLWRRFPEELYPRLVDARSPYRIELAPDAGYSGPAERALGHFRSGQLSSLVVLAGPPVRQTQEPVPILPLEFSWVRFLGVCAAVLGFGLAADALLPTAIRPRGAIVPFFAVTLCALLLAVLATMTTWIQIALPWTALAVAGSFLLVAVGLFAEFHWKMLTKAARDVGRAMRMPENWPPVLLMTLFTARMAHFPIIGFDGRSLWFFKTRQFFEHGMISRADIAEGSLRLSHHEYPLLFPAWSAFFSSLSGAYDERMAAMGIPVLLCATLAMVWVLSRSAMGRLPGAAFTVIAFFSVEGSLGAGYVDGLLCLLVVIEFLSFLLPGFYSVAWVAAGAAALLKREGLILAGLTALLAIVSLPALRLKSAKARWIPFATLLPAAAFAGWMRAIGVEDDYFRLHWSDIISNFPQRAGIVLGGFSEILANGRMNTVTRGRLPVEGLAGLIIALTILFTRRRRSEASSVVSLLLGVSFVAFAFVALLVTPREIHWHVATSVGRLLLLPSLFLVLTACLFLRDLTRE